MNDLSSLKVVALLLFEDKGGMLPILGRETKCQSGIWRDQFDTNLDWTRLMVLAMEGERHEMVAGSCVLRSERAELNWHLQSSHRTAG